MELYTESSYEISKLITNAYSTSFGGATKLFDASIRKHIYAIYGLVRIADEIVDTYKGKNKAELLDELEQSIQVSLKRNYSVNPIVHSFVITANTYGIDYSLIHPFFTSMRMDLSPVIYDKKSYQAYIYGSAEVVGLMCLKVFCENDQKRYKKLERGARALGAAYQKVNFLRDMAADFKDLGRTYFPNVNFETFDDAAKVKIISDIEKDFSLAKKATDALPENSKQAVRLSVIYYEALLKKLKKTKAAVIKQKRVRINDFSKIILLTNETVKRKLRSGS